MDIVAEDRKSARKTVAAAILLVCFAVRIAWIVHSIGCPFYADEPIYDDIARNILNGQGFSRGNPPHPSAFTMPIMPYLVAVVYALSGYSVLAVRILLAALDTLTCFLLMSLGYSLFRRWRIAFLAGIIFSLHPLFIHLYSKLFSDTLLTLLMVSSLTSLLAAHRRDSVKLTALSGLLMALSILTRPTTVLLPAVVGRASVSRQEAWTKVDAQHRLVPTDCLPVGDTLDDTQRACVPQVHPSAHAGR